MRKIREVLRLTHEVRLSVREVSEATGLSKTAVAEHVRRARVIGITWPVPDDIDDTGLEHRLFVPAGFHDGSARRLPEWAKVHEELKRRGVTLMILWEEHRAECPDGHGYSQFCELYGRWRKCLSPVMRQTHVAGDKLFVDWAGDTVPVIDPQTGDVRKAHLFIAALGASSYTYAEARWSEALPDWIGAHANAMDLPVFSGEHFLFLFQPHTSFRTRRGFGRRGSNGACVGYRSLRCRNQWRWSPATGSCSWCAR